MNTINEIYKEIFSYLIELGFKVNQSKFIVSQAAHETANFTSDIFLNNNNLFGMKLAKIRETTAIGEKKYHAVYKTYFESIKDYKIYFEYNGYLQSYSTVDTFIKALKTKKYFEADEEKYLIGVKHFLKLYFNE